MSDVESIGGNLFEEPQDFLPAAPEAHFAHYEREHVPVESASKQKDIELRLVGSSPLWGHYLWNAGIYTAKHLDLHPELVKGKTVLELGAAGGLPSVVSGLIGAKRVVSTDYPDPELVQNIEYNVKGLENVSVEGYIWGDDYSNLVRHIGDDDSQKDKSFDLIILSDLVFNHTEHHKLLKTTSDLLSREGKAIVVFSPHRPWLLEADLDFFKKAQEEYAFTVELIEMVHWTPMFEGDKGPAEVRARVYAYYLTK